MTFVNELLCANLVFSSLSTVVNVTLAVLIVSRLVYHRRYVRNTLGVEHGSPYTNVITMCVESSALMVIVGGLSTILSFASQDGINIMYDITPHICVGGLELNDFWCTASKIFDTTRLSPRSSSSIALLWAAPYPQRYCDRSKWWPRFRSTFQFQILPVKERCDTLLHTSLFHHFPLLRSINIIYNEPDTFSVDAWVLLVSISLTRQDGHYCYFISSNPNSHT